MVFSTTRKLTLTTDKNVTIQKTTQKIFAPLTRQGTKWHPVFDWSYYDQVKYDLCEITDFL